MTPIFAVLTISDSCFRKARQDRSGPAVRALLEQRLGPVGLCEILPDEAAVISQRLRELADGGLYHAVFTTGGTGVAARDVTPEATRAVLDKEIPGLAELMRSEGRKSTPMAVLSRAVCGICGRMLVVNLPGSPQGAVESLSAILDLVPHVLNLLEGITGHPEEGKR